MKTWKVKIITLDKFCAIKILYFFCVFIFNVFPTYSYGYSTNLMLLFLQTENIPSSAHNKSIFIRNTQFVESVYHNTFTTYRTEVGKSEVFFLQREKKKENIIFISNSINDSKTCLNLSEHITLFSVCYIVICIHRSIDVNHNIFQRDKISYT